METEIGLYLGYASIAVLLIFSLWNLLSGAPKADAPPKTTESVPTTDKSKQVEPHKTESDTTADTWESKLSTGLSRTRSEIWGRFARVLSGKKLSPELQDEIEEILFSADLGPGLVDEIIEDLKQESAKGEFDSQKVLNWCFEKFHGILAPLQSEVPDFLYSVESPSQKPKVVMIVGVNGAGKTTTIGKLATKWTQSGAKVVVGACDTFRAAAVEQLEVWCERSGAQIVKSDQNADPASVAYQALETAMREKADYCLIDTAGRLHTYGELMEELAKTKRVLGKLDKTAPDTTLLVIDSITGQNGLAQAKEFHKALGLNGIIYTKCDGSAKAGNAIAIAKDLQIPVTFLGVGENVEDLNRFETKSYLTNLLGNHGTEAALSTP